MDSFQVCDMDILWSLGGYIFRLSCFTLTSWSRNPSIEITLQELNYTAYVMYESKYVFKKQKWGKLEFIVYGTHFSMGILFYIIYICICMYVCMQTDQNQLNVVQLCDSCKIPQCTCLVVRTIL